MSLLGLNVVSIIFHNYFFEGFTAPGPNYSPYTSRGVEKSFGLKFEPVRDKGEPGPAEYTIKSLDRGPEYSLGHKLRDQSSMSVFICLNLVNHCFNHRQSKKWTGNTG